MPLAPYPTRSRRTRVPAPASYIERVVVDRSIEAESLRRRSTEPALCSLCARDASYAVVFKAGRIYCSIECAEAVAGLYLG